MSILFLNILTLLACTQSVDNLFHTLMVLWENEYFLTPNVLLFGVLKSVFNGELQHVLIRFVRRLGDFVDPTLPQSHELRMSTWTVFYSKNYFFLMSHLR